MLKICFFYKVFLVHMKAEKNDLKLSNTTMNNEFKGKRNKVQI